MARVIGVVGGSGGVGASLFAAVLAATAALSGPALLIDLDVVGGGVDVALGIEGASGARWSGVRVAGGELDAQALLAGVPAWFGCPVLAADVDELDPAAVGQVLDAVDLDVDTVVVDLPRVQCAARAAALLRCDLVVVVVRGDLSGAAAAHMQVDSLPELPIGALVRPGGLPVEQVVTLVGVPLLGQLPALSLRRLELQKLPRALVDVAAGVLDGFALQLATA
ncbi:pilus assembly protein FlpE [uncultured Jatrophihabitans sp.]|uniref:pilus assembly protein FlpE n=1 Tax=uncultured Jatrophihabitans sp. TaxID=1610747 RepID=UPI0035CA5320